MTDITINNGREGRNLNSVEDALVVRYFLRERERGTHRETWVAREDYDLETGSLMQELVQEKAWRA